VIRSLAVDDVDRDGALDVVVGFRSGERGTVATLLGDGDGALGQPLEPAAAALGDTRYVAVADLDRDGAPDVVSASGEWIRGPVSAAAASEVSSLELDTPAFAKGVAVADVNHIAAQGF